MPKKTINFYTLKYKQLKGKEMKETVALAKAVDAKEEFSPTRSDNNIQGL